MNASSHSSAGQPARLGDPSVADYLVMALFLVFAYCTGAGDGSEPSSAAGPAPAAAATPLLLRLVIPQRTSAGQPITMTLVVENQGETEIEIGLGGQPTAFDFVVRDAQGREIWRRLEGVPVESILLVRTLGPGEMIEFTDAWDQRDNSGDRVEPGTYYVSGILPLADQPDGLETEPQELQLEG